MPPKLVRPAFCIGNRVNVIAPFGVAHTGGVGRASMFDITAVDELVFVSLAAVWTMYVDHLVSLLAVAVAGTFEN